MSSNKAHKQSFSAEDILRYHKGQLSDTEMNEMEQRALDDPFLDDALEGWSGESDASLLSELQKDLKGNDTSSRSVNKDGWKKLLLFGGMAVLIYAGYDMMSDLNAVADMTTEVHHHDEASQAPFLISPQQDALDEMEIKYSTELPAEERLDVELVKSEMLSVEEVKEEEVVRKEVVPLELPSKEKTVIEKEKPSPELVLKKDAIYYVHGLKVADYRTIRLAAESEVTVWTVLSNHVPARYENEGAAKTSSPEFEVSKVAYVDYLDEAMAFFAKGDYKEALTRYRVILKNYPNDLNAHFYGGLSYYNLNRQKKASSYLAIAQNHGIKAFGQEAEYYRALSLVKGKKISEARYLLKNIVDKDSFYSSRALELLGNLK